MTSAAPRKRLAYILAPSHSGSTLLAMLLAAHPDVCTAGELNLGAIDDPETYRCSCGALLRECGFWTKVARRMAERGLPFDVLHAQMDYRERTDRLTRRLLAPLHRGRRAERLRDLALACSPSWRARYRAQQVRNAALVQCLAEESGASVVVDSSKIGIRLKFLLRNPELEVRVIRLVRDGRAVAVTYMNPAEFADAQDPGLRGGGAGGTRAHERLPIDRAAREWRRSHEEAETVISALAADQWMQIHYEALCERTEATLQTIYGFLGVESGRMRLDFRSVEHHVVGNGMRLDRSSAVSLDRRWTTVWTDREQAVFDAVAGGLNRTFGYTG